MKRDEYVKENMMKRPYWTAEEFIATRILRSIGASGQKAYDQLVHAIDQVLPECPRTCRWDVASFLLKRRIRLNLVVQDPRVIGLPYHVLEEGGTRKPNIAKYLRNSPFTSQSSSGNFQDFYLFRMADDSIDTARVTWNLDVVGHITPSFVVHEGNAGSRIVIQDLETFLKEIEFQDITNELMV
jgi:hypothetical protein